MRKLLSAFFLLTISVLMVLISYGPVEKLSAESEKKYLCYKCSGKEKFVCSKNYRDGWKKRKKASKKLGCKTVKKDYCKEALCSDWI